jgi:hypothetical protein
MYLFDAQLRHRSEMFNSVCSAKEAPRPFAHCTDQEDINAKEKTAFEDLTEALIKSDASKRFSGE